MPYLEGIVDCQWSKDEDIEKKWKNAYFFGLKLSQNHIEMCSECDFNIGYCHHMCPVHVECIYWQFTQSTEDLRKMLIFQNF